MPSLRGLRLAFSFLTVPAGIGVAAHQLTDKYKSLMDFTSTYFLVKVTQGLGDDGIPEVPPEVDKAVETIMKLRADAEKHLKKRQKRQLQDSGDILDSDDDLTAPQVEVNSTPTKSTKQPVEEIFKDKKFWCRYFDYTGGKDKVILEYDPYCQIYNIFDFYKNNGDSVTSAKKSWTVGISDIQRGTVKLEKIKNSSEFKAGGFYLLQLDKTRIPNVNSSFEIELSVPGKLHRRSEKIYHKKLATLKVQAPLTGDPLDNVAFKFSNPLPSSRLILQKVNNKVGVKTDAPSPSVSFSGPASSDDDSPSYYFKNNNNKDEKLFVEQVYSFGSDTTTTGTKTNSNSDLTSKFDLSTLDTESLENFDSKSSTQPTNDAKFYLFRNSNSSWIYRPGDLITLHRSVKKKTIPIKDGETGTDDQEEETKLETFKVISGALLHHGVPINCISSTQNQQSKFKENLKKNKKLLIRERVENKGLCKPQEGIPEHVLILINNNEDTQTTSNN